MNMKFRPIAIYCALLISTIANATTGASSLQTQVYAVMLSSSPQCTSPVTVFSSTTPTEVDFLAAPTLGSGNPPDGTYNCVIIKMLDTIKFKPASSDGVSCVGGTQYTTDVCQTGETTLAPDSVSAPTPCTSSAPDVVYLYLTTGRIGSGGGNAFLQPLPPNTTTHGVSLSAPLIVSGTATAKFVANAAGQVDGAGGSCSMNPPAFGFQKLP
jgi:hypothetical protein